MKKRLSLLLMLVTLAAGCTDEPAASDDSEASESTGTEWQQLMAACMDDAGWEVELAPDGAVEMEGIPDSQFDKYNEDFEICNSEVSAEIPDESLTRDQAASLFDEYLEAAECLRELGIEVPPAPSRESGIESLLQGTFGREWNPYDSVAELPSEDEYFEAYTKCPKPER